MWTFLVTALAVVVGSVVGLSKLPVWSNLGIRRRLASVLLPEDDEVFVWHDFPKQIFTWKFLCDYVNPFYGLDMNIVHYNKPRPGDYMLADAIIIIHRRPNDDNTSSEEEETAQGGDAEPEAMASLANSCA